jgi:hypothetical protein
VGSFARVIAVIHMGLHKTGSTLVQYLAAYNAKALLQRGVYFKPGLGYPAHHDESADVLRGDFRRIRNTVSRARRLGAQTLFISSENFENLLFDPKTALALASALKSAGCDETVFALYVRDQTETFWSLYSELSRHVAVDAVEMLRFVLNRGFYAVEPSLNDEARRRQWRFSFDHARFVTQFRDALAATPDVSLRVYDFGEFDGYPGDAMFRDMGVEAAITRFPALTNVNMSLSCAVVRSNYLRHWAGLGRVPPFLLLNDQAELKRRTRISELLSRRFGGTNGRLFAALAETPSPAAIPKRMRA